MTATPQTAEDPRITDLRARLDELRNLKPGWFEPPDEPGQVPDAWSLDTAFALCAVILNTPGCPLPCVAPHPEGGVRTEALGEHAFFIIDVSSTEVDAILGPFSGYENVKRQSYPRPAFDYARDEIAQRFAAQIADLWRTFEKEAL